MSKRNRWIAVIISLVGLVAVILLWQYSRGALPNSAGSALAQGDALYQSRDYDAALAAYAQAIDSGQDLAKAHLGRGNVYTARRRLDLATIEYTTSLELERTSAALVGRCNVYRLQASLELALDDCNEAVALAPNSSEAHAMLAVLYIEQQNLAQARVEALAATDLDSNSATAYHILSQVELAQGQMESAIEALSKCIEIEPEGPTCYWERGFLYLNLARIEEAAADFKSVVRVGNPELDGEIMFKAGTQLRVMGEEP